MNRGPLPPPYYPPPERRVVQVDTGCIGCLLVVIVAWMAAVAFTYLFG